MDESMTQEWTLQRLAPYMGKRDNYEALLGDINAALAAERDWREQAGKQLDEVHRDLIVERDKLRGVTAGFEQVLLELAAERELRKPLVEALMGIRKVLAKYPYFTNTIAEIDAALAKVKDKP